MGRRQRRRRTATGPRTAPTDVAIVFVHGIGTQTHGSTAEEGARCLSLGLDDFRVEGSRTVDGVHVIEASASATNGRRTRMAVIDGWWDDVVDQPQGLTSRAWHVLGWIARVAPVALMLSAALASAGGDARRARKQPRRRRWPLPARSRMSVDLQSILWRAIIAPPVLIAALAVAAATLLMARDHRMSRIVLHCIGKVVGDAYAFCRDADAFDAMCDRTRHVLDVASRTGRRVVLVGHSQGAAICRAVCATANPVDALVTVGAGTQQLGALRHLRPWHTVVGWLILLLYPGLLSFAVLLTIQEVARILTATLLAMTGVFQGLMSGATPEATANLDRTSQVFFSLIWSPLWFLTLGVFLVVVVVHLVNRNIQAPEEHTHPKVKTWHDVSSILDPVCPGGAHLEDGAIATEVTNTSHAHEVLQEHTRYFANPALAEVLIRAIIGAGAQRVQLARQETPSGRQRLLRTFSWWGWPLTFTLTSAVVIGWWDVVGATTRLLAHAWP